jgi:hypothetical protein
LQNAHFIRSPFSVVPFFLLLGWKLLFFILYQFKIEDLWHQQQLAVHLAHGWGLNYLHASVADLSQWNPELLLKWPPLFPVLLAGLLKLQLSIDTATYFLVFLAFLLLVSSVRILVGLLQLSAPAQWFIWIVLLLNPVLTDLFSVTDLLSLSLWIAGFAKLLQQLLVGKKIPWPLLAMLLFLPAAFRYQYYPLVLVLPVSVLLMALGNRNRKMQINGVLLLVGVSFLLLLQILILRYVAGSAAYLADMPGGSVTNLTRMAPFFLYAFLPVYIPVNVLAGPMGLEVQYLYSITGMVSLLLFVVFLLLLLRYPATGKHQVFRYTATMSIAVLFVYLCVLSFRYQQQVNGATTFTYVQEPRYWGIALLLLPLLLASWMDTSRLTIIPQIALLALLLNGAPVMYRLYRTVTESNHPALYSYRTSFKHAAGRLIESDVKTANRPVVLASFDFDFGMLNYTKPYALVPFDTLLSKGTLKSSKPVWFYMITRDTLQPAELQFIRTNQLQLKLRQKGWYRLYRPLQP